jgi:hypothetical protein
MAENTLSADELQSLLGMAQGWGKIVARRAAEADLDLETADFNTLEQLAQSVAAALTQGTLESLLALQNQKFPEQIACPECGSICETRFQPRQILVGGGLTFTYQEPVGHCTRCRRDFFPSPSPTTTEQP